MDPLLSRAEAEVIARHEFFVRWFTGAGIAAQMEASARAFAPDMQRIAPDGAVQDAGEVIAMIRGAKGTAAADFAIRIEGQGARMIGDGTALVVYDEHQQAGGKATQRRATALFTADAGAPEGVLWRHLQETWIAP